MVIGTFDGYPLSHADGVTASRLPARSAAGQRATGARSPPLPRPYFCERKGCAGAGGGDYSIHLISKGALPPLKPPKGQGKRKVKETPPVAFGDMSRLPPRSAMDGRHWRPSPPFEMRCIEYSPPPVQKSHPPFLIPLTGGGRGWGEMGHPLSHDGGVTAPRFSCSSWRGGTLGER